jgi:co-chaperonin GroES (HSP10)
MKAIGQYIALQPIKEEIVASGIVLSMEDMKKQRFMKGAIVSCGHEIPADILKEGDIVYYDTANAFEMVVQERNVVIIRLRDIVAAE